MAAIDSSEDGIDIVETGLVVVGNISNVTNREAFCCVKFGLKPAFQENGSEPRKLVFILQ